MIALALLAAAPLTCGAVPRPGIGALDEAGRWHGTAVDACRRAAARLGRAGFRFHGYRSRAQLVAAGRDDVAFLSAAERQTVLPTAAIVTPAIAVSRQLLVAKSPTIASDRPVICFIIGTAAEDALATWLEATRRDAIRLGFQEPDEMADGVASGKCAGAAIDAADRHPADRIVATLAALPIDAVSSSARATTMIRALRD